MKAEFDAEIRNGLVVKAGFMLIRLTPTTTCAR